jgi:peptidoglycan/xylan/chitin deacetylase (PgdA/CDA1 family)
VTRGRLAVHAHFYQPSRLDPWTGRVPAEPSAAPFHDWNQRVAAECYRPNAERGNLGRISWNLGPTLAAWLASDDPATHARFVADSATAIAQAYHHPILPLASAADRRTEIAWGNRDFEVRFGRRPTGLWLPETAVDRATLREAAAQGIAFTILAPWQAAEPVDSRRPYRVDLGDGEGILVFFYDSGLSASVSFEPEATGDADRFARERVATRLGGGPDPLDDPLAVIATDGELYGHHQQFRDLFLQRLLEPEPGAADRGFDVVTLAQVAAASVGHTQHPIRIADRTSWSCHHGVARWGGECPDAADGRWKAPLRAALDRLAGAIDAVTETEVAGLPGDVDPDATRDAYIEVVAGSTSGADFAAARWPGATDSARARILDLLEAQRWRLAMFASDGWFWDDPIRPETRQVLRAAARAVRLVDGVAGTHLERRLVADLGSFTSPSRGLDGSAIYRMALADIDQPPPAG